MHSRECAKYFIFRFLKRAGGAQDESYTRRKFAPLFFRCSSQEHGQYVLGRPAHFLHELSVWAPGDKTEFLTCFLLARARARGLICVQHIVSNFCVPPSRSSCSRKCNYLLAVQETANSSAWNHIIKFQRRGPPRRRARKVLSIGRTHGSAPYGVNRKVRS